MKKRIVFVVFVIVIMLPLAHATNLNACGTINTDGDTYTLTQNISGVGTCITIGASNITLDGNGFIITTKSAVGYGVSVSGYNNTIIKNAYFNSSYGGNYGIYFSSSNASTVFNNSFNMTNTGGIKAIYLNYSNISNNNITKRNNGLSNIDLDKSSYNDIYNNTIDSQVSGLGIRMVLSSSFNNISNNLLNSSSSSVLIQIASNSNNNILISNNLSGKTGVSIGVTSNNHTFRDNVINITTGSNDPIDVYSNNNTFENNTLVATGASGWGIYIGPASMGNQIYNGSIISLLQDAYYIASPYENNTFKNTNFTAPRQIELSSATSVFNYSNNNGGAWISTNFSVASILTRNITNWSQINITFNENAASGTPTGYYNTSGLLSSSKYEIWNNTNIDYNLTTDARGTLPQFLINHNTSSKTITVLWKSRVNFTFSNITQSENQIYQSSQANIIRVDVNDTDGYISNIDVGITLNGVETNYTMSGGNDTWSYLFKSGTPGLYSITGFYATDNTGGTNSTGSTLTFTVVPGLPGGSIGGQPYLSLPALNKSQGANLTAANVSKVIYQTIQTANKSQIAFIAIVLFLGAFLIIPKKE